MRPRKRKVKPVRRDNHFPYHPIQWEAFNETDPLRLSGALDETPVLRAEINHVSPTIRVLIAIRLTIFQYSEFPLQ
jgi:hypothetical protein